MDETTTLDAEAEAAAPAPDTELAASADEGVEDELLIEEVSIDGMCGVY